MKRKYNSEKDNTPFLAKHNLISIQDAKKIKYDHQLNSRYAQNLTYNDLGAVLHLLYLKHQFPSINIGFTKEQFLQNFRLNSELNEQLETIDEDLSIEDNPEFLIFYNGKKLYHHPKLFDKINQSKLSVFIISHESIEGCGHFGLFIIRDNVGTFYDCNGKILYLEYYKLFIENLKSLCCKLKIKFQWDGNPKGIQIWQMNESNKYKMDLRGCCGSWTFYFAYQISLHQFTKSCKEIEDKLKVRYKNYLTRFIVTYQQKIHETLWKLLMDDIKLLN